MLGLFSIFLASLVQGITGFGFALIAVPLLSIFIPDIKNITPLIVFYSLMTNIIIVYKAKGSIDLKKVLPLIVFGVISIPIGTSMLIYVKAETLKTVIGFVIVITAMAMYKNFKVRITNETLSYGVVGILSGLLNGSAGLSGPPVVLFLTNQNIDKDQFRANITFYGIATNIFAVIIFFIQGFITTPVLHSAAAYLPVLFIGVIAGIRLSRRINEILFRKLTIYLIAVLGLYTSVSAIIN